ncbi:MAG: hypothetical protein M3021_10170 [Actinomycetota bacterium]|nr:hypothetical protein [Actinomycetota bacterium]
MTAGASGDDAAASRGETGARGGLPDDHRQRQHAALPAVRISRGRMLGGARTAGTGR